MTTTDTGYTTLLSHLQCSETTFPLPTIEALIAHYLAHLTPYPTSFAATTISSPFFHHLSHNKLEVLTNAFRFATHLKYNAYREDQHRFFSRSLKTRLDRWLSAVLVGIHGGPPIVRLASCGGMRAGLEDLKQQLRLGDGIVRRDLEDAIVMALAEFMDKSQCYQSSNDWEDEFQAEARNREGSFSHLLSIFWVM
jgi:hypothetical protein